MKLGKSNYEFVPVGGKRNNISIINIGTDPASGVTERITNAIDAVIEKKWKTDPVKGDIESPREAIESWYGIKEGKISNIKNPNDKRIKNLSKDVVVTLFDSGKPKKPTIQIRDNGLGLKSNEFANTILSLNSNNKIDKKYVIGSFGQGGSTALSYNDLTIIISKPFSTNKKTQKCAWTIVRINHGDVNIDKNAWFEYIVDKKTNQPFEIEISDKEFSPGTLVRHIMMDVGKYKGKITTPTNSFWFLSHNYLFDPIIPFTIEDKRKDIVERRTVTGNSRLLTYTENLEYLNSCSLTFKTGSVSLKYWVLNTKGANPRDRIQHYTLPSQPIIITLNGQKQGYISNSLIKKDLKLPFLERYLIVQIETDYLDNNSKRELFSSTRESLRDTSIYQDLKQMLIDTLSNDEMLNKLDSDRKRRYFIENENLEIEKVKNSLSVKLNRYLKQNSYNQIINNSSPLDQLSKNKKIKVSTEPKLLEFLESGYKEVTAGNNFILKFKTDIHPGYFQNSESFFVDLDHNLGFYSGSVKVENGYGFISVRSNKNIKADKKGEVKMEVKIAEDVSLCCTQKILCIEKKKKQSQQQDNFNLSVQYLFKDNPWYKENKWNENTIAEVIEDSNEFTIYVSGENKNLQKLIEKAQRVNSKGVSNIRNKYLELISYAAFINSKNNYKNLFNGDYDKYSEKLDPIFQINMQNASESICNMIDDFFQPVIKDSN